VQKYYEQATGLILSFKPKVLENHISCHTWRLNTYNIEKHVAHFQKAEFTLYIFDSGFKVYVALRNRKLYYFLLKYESNACIRESLRTGGKAHLVNNCNLSDNSIRKLYSSSNILRSYVRNLERRVFVK
jgi:mevalonate pyrophosphate decarboxylase